MRSVPRRLRVCMLVTYDLALNGGVKQHAVNLAHQLRLGGDDVTVIGPTSRELTEPDTYGFRGVVNVHSNGSDNHLGIFVCPYKVGRFFHENRFDVIHIHEPLNPSMSYWATWLARDVPHVATFHAFSEAESPAKRIARQVFGVTMEPWFQRAIAVSEPARRYAALAWKSPLAVIPNGVPTRQFRPAPFVDHGGPLKLLFVGRLGDPRKGARYIIEAYRQLVEQKVPVTLDLVGELGASPPPPALPGLTYHGGVSLERLIEHYRACDVFIAPSTGQESFGIILLEAMASAKPVICSGIEGYRQVATTPGSILVPPSDATALARAIADFVGIDAATRRRMAEINVEHARSFDWEVVTARVRGEYLAAMGLSVEPLEARTAPREEAPAVPATGTR